MYERTFISVQSLYDEYIYFTKHPNNPEELIPSVYKKIELIYVFRKDFSFRTQKKKKKWKYKLLVSSKVQIINGQK